jgi:hypothetical protein
MSFRKEVTCGVLTAPALAELLAILRQVQMWGGSGEIVLSSEKPRLEYELPGVPGDLTGSLEEAPFDDWQMAVDDLTNTVFANSVLSAGLNYNDLVVLEGYMKCAGGKTVDEVVNDLNKDAHNNIIVGPTTLQGGNNGKFIVPSSVDLAKQMKRMIDKDQAEFVDPLPVLQHTTCCSPGSLYNVERANEMRIYSTAQLLSEVGSGWTYNLPGALYSQIASFPTRSAAAEEAAYFTWGWLKTRATQRTQTNFGIERHQEYKLNLWPNIYYALA